MGNKATTAVASAAGLALAGCSLASRAYPNGCADQPITYYDYDSYSLLSSIDTPFRSHDDFLIVRRLGVGKFSDVFEAVDMRLLKQISNQDNASNFLDQTVVNGYHPKAVCVIKCLKPVSEKKIKRELMVLCHTRKLPNMIRLLGIVFREDSHDVSDGTFIVDRSKDDTSILTSIKINEMPSLVFNHVGQNSRWLCHGIGADSSFVHQSYHNNPDHEHVPPFYLTEYEMKYYLCHLLIALDALHSKGIMHRDIKPRNVLVNRLWPIQTHGINRERHSYSSNKDHSFSNEKPSHTSTKSQGIAVFDDKIIPVSPLVLIDFGLADFYLPNKNYNVRVASRHYKAPELLLGYEFYDYGIDMWGVGCILAGLLFRREPFFRGKDNTDQLDKIVSVLGSIDLIKYCQKYGIPMTSHVESIIAAYDSKDETQGKRKSWLTFLQRERNYDRKELCPIPSIESIDLLDQLLVYDHDKRLTAKEAFMHPFFHEVRERIQFEVGRISINLH